jgi:hypothetical protein
VEIDGQVPAPPSERGRFALAATVAALGAGTLVAVLSGAVGRQRLLPPALPTRAALPTPAALTRDPSTGRQTFAAASTAGHRGAAIVAKASRSGAQRSASPQNGTPGFQNVLSTTVPTSWIEGFYPIYERAQRAFRVNWLLIASIHAQETAFSTAPSTYHGLNFAHCCGGPMQFNVTDGSARPPNGSARPPGTLSTWAQVANSYRYAKRPAHYDHMTSHHPSIYDDFDSIMAAAHLLSLDGAGYALDDSAWWAAYDYYGHDAYGVTYADEVLARAIGWSQHGFCTGCGVSSALITAVQAAYGAPVDAQLEAEEAALKRQRTARSARRRPGRSRRRCPRSACAQADHA